METISLQKLLFSILIITTLFFFPLLLQAKDDDYARPPPGKLLNPHHDRSESEPEQVHISLVGKDHMRVSWVTEAKHTPSIVAYGKEPGKYDTKATGDHTSYKYLFYSSGKIHHVKIGPLEPSTTYFYRCGGSGPEFSFRMPPASFPVEFVVVGDLGQTQWTNSTLQHVESQDYDVFLLPGDLSYADIHQPLWDSFGRLVEPYATRRPWMVTQGNHEIESIPIIHPTPFKSYNARWRMPYEESGSNSNLFYSFDVAGAHIIMLGSYTDFDSDSDQYKWFVSDLGRVDRRKTPWVFVLLHAPWYNTNEAHQGEGEKMRKAMEELVFRGGVDIVFSGHVHAYERFTRVYDNKADSCGPVYITIGDGGNREGLALKFKRPPSPLSLFREPSFGHGRLRVVNETHAHWSWHRNDDTITVEADELWLESLSSTKTCWDTSSSIVDHDEL